MMLKQVFACVGLSLIVMGHAFADGINKPRVHTPLPSPLKVQPQASPNGPVVHYANPSQAGTRIYSTSCVNGVVETCSGQYVSTGRVVLAGEAPPYVESVPPVIHRGEYQDAAPIRKPVRHHKHHGDCCCCEKKASGQQIHLDGNLTGGVGAGVSSNWVSSGGSFVSPVYPMVRSRSSVMYHPSSAYVVRHRPYVVLKRHRRH